MASREKIKTEITLEGIRHNQKYLERWDQYQVDWLNSVKLEPHRPILLPIAIDIKGRKIERRLMSNSEIEKLTKSKDAPDEIYFADTSYSLSEIFEHYVDGMKKAVVNPKPPKGLAPLSKIKSPLDLSQSCPVLLLFTVPGRNLFFKAEKAYSIDNLNGDPYCQAVDVIKTFDSGKALCVLNNNWVPESRKAYRLKYNLHLLVKQRMDNENMFTEITIDPGGNGDDATRGMP